MKRLMILVLVLLSTVFFVSKTVLAADSITILYESMSKPDPKLIMDWGYAALIEYNGKRILFDAGREPAILENNVKALGIDLTKLDAVIFSHRHHDHTVGAEYLFKVNPDVKVYAAKDPHFGGAMPKSFFKKESSLPVEMQYFGGNPPDKIQRHNYMPYENITTIGKVTEIFPGFFLVPNKSYVGEEISLHINTPEGQIVVTGCAHPGIEAILESSKDIDPRIHFVIGGLHWVPKNKEEIETLTASLHDKWQAKWVASAHCTGELGTATLMRVFGDHYVYAGLGTTIEL
jgi:7,8-dihydropterin-6-yl-methyl-4-(beta-D-ribofuranosyl)aminobenzene 5'-phosphate synthase